MKRRKQESLLLLRKNGDVDPHAANDDDSPPLPLFQPTGNNPRFFATAYNNNCVEADSKVVAHKNTTGPALVRRRKRKQKRQSPHSVSILAFSIPVGLVVFVLLSILRRIIFPTNGGLPFYYPNPDDTATDDVSWNAITSKLLQTNDQQEQQQPYPLLHIVNTRFMQEQSQYQMLTQARYELFDTFCLPTMQQQTTQQFLWIIKVDPNLDKTTMKQMIDSFDNAPNYFLVGSNNNYGIHPKFMGSWKDGVEINDLKRSKVYSGNQQLLEAAMLLVTGERESPPLILETRLDADDGLDLTLLRDVQEQARHDFGRNSDLKWKYWCARRSIEWHWAPKAAGDTHEARLQGKEGVILPIGHEHLCITPGITVGYGIETPGQDVPIFSHTDIVQNLTDSNSGVSCGLPTSKSCLSFFEKQRFAAIRSRTPTSTGMLDVVAKESIALDYSKYHSDFCGLVQHDFGISRNNLASINDYITLNILAIAEENLAGQCKTGHSCKVRCRFHKLAAEHFRQPHVSLFVRILQGKLWKS